MRYSLLIHPGFPRKEGEFYYVTQAPSGMLHLDRYSYIPNNGWNTFREASGAVNAEFEITPSENYIGWAEIEKSFDTETYLKDILEQADQLKKGDPNEYHSESEMDYWNALDEFREHLDIALGFLVELKGAI